MSYLVECRSEFVYAERPVSLLWEGKRLQVEAVLASWRSPEGISFRVRAEDKGHYVLTYCEADDEWHVYPT